MTKSVEDNALLLGIIAGADPADRMCSERPPDDYLKLLRAGVRGLRIGLPKNYFLEYATRDVGEAVREAARTLERQGASIHDVDLPHLKYAIGAETAIIFAEPLAYHQKYIRQGKFDEYTDLNKASWDAARFVSGADYVQSQRVRRFMIRDFEKAFEQVDVIFAPGVATEANPIEEDLLTYKLPTRDVPAGMITLWEIVSRMTFPANLTGVPALVLPCGFSTAGLPLSLQVMGRHYDEGTVYRVGAAYEQATDWHSRRPELA
jgi:aspartyl-tRNA(Asn)/glutamyl-tRNA(Gln) amidotransferase subunit A